MQIRQFKISAILLALYLMACQNQAPISPGNSALIELRLNLIGEQITQPGFLKYSPSNFTRLNVLVYAEGAVTDCLDEREPLVTKALEISPDDGTFEGILTVPAGENRLFVVKLFEQSLADTGITVNPTVFLSYCGRQAGVSIQTGEVHTISVDLYPVPVQQKRVVFWVYSVSLAVDSSRISLPIGVATLDSLRGLQFDLRANPSIVKIDSVYAAETGPQFSNLLFNHIPEQGDRVIIFDQTNRYHALPPVYDACAVPIPAFLLDVTLDTEQIYETSLIDIFLQSGVVSVKDFHNLEVYAIDGQINIGR